MKPKIGAVKTSTAQAVDADTQLVHRARGGDRRAFDMLMTKYRHRILYLVGRIVHDREQAQDVCQEVFIRAYQGLAKFRGDSAFYTWLYRIALNTARNHVAGLLRWPATVSLDENKEPIEPAGPLISSTRPDHELHLQQLREVIKRCFQCTTGGFEDGNYPA